MQLPRTVAVLAALGLVAVPAAGAKDFRPGDLRVCDAARCVPIVDRAVVGLLGRFYYAGGSPPAAAAPRLRAPTLELRFRDGYATGIVATARFDRFLSFGVDVGRFERGRWYRVPAAMAAELRRLAAGLAPLPLTRAALARSR